MTRCRLALIPLILTICTPALADDPPQTWWVGTWTVIEGQCSDMDDARSVWGPEQVQFWESTCTVDRVIEIVEGEVVLTLGCGGEGETWERSVNLVALNSGSQMQATFEDVSTPVVHYACRR